MRTLDIVSVLLGMSLIHATQAHAADEAQRAALMRAAERGEQIYELDQAAWVSADDMLSKAPQPEKLGIVGWIVEDAGDHLRVTYYKWVGEEPRAAFVADTRGRQVIASHVLAKDDDGKLTNVETRMIRAREIARRQRAPACTDAPMNTVVLPPVSPGEPVAVYVLSAQVKNGEYPFGGHYEFDIGDDGKVVFARRFMKTCLNLSSSGPAGEKVVGMTVSHLLDQTPTEIHVFLSRTIGLPVIVATPPTDPAAPDSYQVWKVDGRDISVLSPSTSAK